MEEQKVSETSALNVQIQEIPPNLTVKILKKMQQKEGLRMMQTGLYAEELIQMGHVRFGQSENLLWLALCFDINHTFSVHIGRLVGSEVEFFKINGPLDFLSSLTFTTIFVVCGVHGRHCLRYIPPSDRAIWSEDVAIVLLPILKHIRLRCTVLRIHGVCYVQMKQIMRLVSFWKLWDHNHAHHIDNVIALFNEGRFIHKHFDVFCNVPVRDLLRKIRDFDCVGLHRHDPFDPQEFAQFIRDCRNNPTGRLRKFTMSICHRNRATYIDEWPNCIEAWFGCISRFDPGHVGQLHTFQTPSKLGIIFTKDWEWSKLHTVYFFNFADEADMARLTIKIIKFLCPCIPIDGSSIFRALCRSAKAEIPFVLTDHLNLIYSPPVMYPINVIRRGHNSAPDFLEF